MDRLVVPLGKGRHAEIDFPDLESMDDSDWKVVEATLAHIAAIAKIDADRPVPPLDYVI